jgi:ABC-type nitrate/sulfonate/bicarbonate transport system substrate-binding protein
MPMPHLITEGIITNGKKLPMYVLAQLNTQGNGIAIARIHAGKGLNLDITKAAEYIKGFPQSNGRKFKAAHTFPNVNQDFWIRYWFAAGGVDPDTDIDLLAVPPAETVQGMRNGTMDAFSTGDPWPYRIVTEDIGHMAALTAQIWKFHPEEYLAIRGDWVDQNPKATKAILKGVMEAQQWCDDPTNRPELIEIVAGRNYFNVPPDILQAPYKGMYKMGDGQPDINDFNMGPLYWKAERKEIIEQQIKLVGLGHAVDKYPKQLSGGMKQRVAIARALSIRPKLLLLDEPFGTLDALTRGNLQEQLMRICEEYKITSVMVTHDVDEAVLLSDRIVMLTNGPKSKIGGILEVDIPRPRQRMEVVNHPSYYSLRSEIIYFLNQQKRIKKLRAKKTDAIPRHGLEKVNLEVEYAHHMFFGEGMNRPSRTEHLWMMTQMARWGHIPFPRNWVEILERVCRVGVFSTAARELGMVDIKYRREPIKLFDGVTFDAEDPVNYLNELAIKQNFTMAEVHLDGIKTPIAVAA